MSRRGSRNVLGPGYYDHVPGSGRRGGSKMKLDAASGTMKPARLDRGGHSHGAVGDATQMVRGWQNTEGNLDQYRVKMAAQQMIQTEKENRYLKFGVLIGIVALILFSLANLGVNVLAVRLTKDSFSQPVADLEPASSSQDSQQLVGSMLVDAEGGPLAAAMAMDSIDMERLRALDPDQLIEEVEFDWIRGIDVDGGQSVVSARVDYVRHNRSSGWTEIGLQTGDYLMVNEMAVWFHGAGGATPVIVDADPSVVGPSAASYLVDEQLGDGGKRSVEQTGVREIDQYTQDPVAEPIKRTLIAVRKKVRPVKKFPDGQGPTRGSGSSSKPKCERFGLRFERVHEESSVHKLTPCQMNIRVALECTSAYSLACKGGRPMCPVKVVAVDYKQMKKGTRCCVRRDHPGMECDCPPKVDICQFFWNPLQKDASGNFVFSQ